MSPLSWAINPHLMMLAIVFCLWDFHGLVPAVRSLTFLYSQQREVAAYVSGLICLLKALQDISADYIEHLAHLQDLRHYLTPNTSSYLVLWLMSCPWRLTRWGWIGLWATWLSCGIPVHCRRVRLDGPQRSLPTLRILWLQDIEMITPCF